MVSDLSIGNTPFPEYAKASFKLTAEVVEAMEEVLYEIAPSKWYVIENRITGDGFLEEFLKKTKCSLQQFDHFPITSISTV